jgi:DNA polymerase-3 subunit alpha
MRTTKITKIKYIGKQRVVDIEVNNKSHTFYGNGIATSNSHSVSYGLYSYITAYAKAHFPRVFFTAYLRYAYMKIKPKEEIKSLINNARQMNIDVMPPKFSLLNKRFKLHNKKIYFGLLDIKGIGESGFNKAVELINTINVDLDSIKWFDFLIILSDGLKTTIVESLICAGALGYNLDRTQMLFEYQQYIKMTELERKWIKENYTKYNNLVEVIESIITMKTGRGQPISSSKRLKSVESILKILKNPPYSLKDSIPWIAATEENLLGIAMTCTNVDACDQSLANSTCQEILRGTELTKTIILAVNVEEVKEHMAKNKSEMAFLKVSDITGVLESVVVFSDQWKQYKNMLVQGNTVLLFGKRDKSKESFLVNKVFQI